MSTGSSNFPAQEDEQPAVASRCRIAQRCPSVKDTLRELFPQFTGMGTGGSALSKPAQLWEACAYGREDALAKLLDSTTESSNSTKIDVNALHSLHDCRPLHVASQGKLGVVRRLLDAGALVDALDLKENTALMLAAQTGHADICELLLQNGADVSLRNRLGWTALISAAYWVHPRVLEVLLRHGAKVSVENTTGRQALHELCRAPAEPPVIQEDLEAAASHLLAFGADINARCLSSDDSSSTRGFTPLLYATFHGRAQLADWLLDRGADLKASDSSGWTALHWAVSRGFRELAGLLVRRGADLNARDARGQTAAELDSEDPDLISYILPLYPEVVSNGYVTTDEESNPEDDVEEDDVDDYGDN